MPATVPGQALVGTFKVGNGYLVGQALISVPGVYPSNFNASITNQATCGDGHVSLGTPGTQFGTPTFTVRLPVITPGGVPSAQAFGAVTIKGVFRQTVSGVPSAQAFGALTIKAVRVVVLGGVASAQSFGAVTPKSVFVRTVGGVSSAQAFGAPTFKLSIVKPTGGVPSAQAFGTSTIKTVVSQAVTGVSTAQAFGIPTIKATRTLALTGLGSAQAFGAITTRTGFSKPVGGVSSAQAFGAVSTRQITSVVVPGVDTAQMFGTARTRLNISVPSVPSAQAFGSAEFGFEVYHAWLHDLHCIGTPSETICGPPICGMDWVCGGYSFVEELECIEDDGGGRPGAICNMFIVGDGTLVGQQPIAGSPGDFFLDDLDCLEAQSDSICGVPICNDGHVCGGVAFNYQLGSDELDLSELPPPLVLDLEPATCA